jgi:hypothetical protein
MNRIRMKINVIFIPYCNFATNGLSLLEALLAYGLGHGGNADGCLCVHEGEHLPTDGKWERNDEKHEQCHL